MKKTSRKIKTNKNISEIIYFFAVKNSFILLLLSAIFFLRVPFLFEPLTNGNEALILTATKNLLPSGYALSFFDLVATFFSKATFFLFEPTLWSVRFGLTLFILINFIILYFLTKKFLTKKIYQIFLIILAVIFSLPFFGFNSLSFSALILLPLLSVIAFVFTRESKLNKNIFLAISALIIVFFSFVIFNRLVNFSYYLNFFNYSIGKVTAKVDPEENYYKSFGKDTLTTNSLAAFIKSKTKADDKIYLYGDLNAIYPLSERVPASKYISSRDALANSDNLFEELTDNKPAFLLIETTAPKLGQLDRLTASRYNLSAQTENVIIYKLKGL